MSGDGVDVHIEGLVNARDLGGLPRRDGSTTPHGVFVRSARVDHLTAAGWAQLGAAGIRSVVDLRQSAERDALGARPDWVVTLHVDHDGLENTAFWSAYWDDGRSGTALYYLPHIAAMPERTVAVLAAIADAPPGGVLVHCTRGRDRTGLIGALLLLAAGVEREAVVADYLRSVASAGELADVLGVDIDEAETEAVCAAWGTTVEGAFRAALDGLDLDALLGRLQPEQRAAIRTWRGSLSPSAAC